MIILFFKKKFNIHSETIFRSIVIFGVFLFLFLSFNVISLVSQETVSNSKEYLPIIILDAGHGGEDGGASSDDGILEKDINLKIALKLRDMLNLSGFDVKMTRDKDISIYDQSAKSVREQKVSDLKNRLAMVNENTNNILLSIHQNKFTQSKYFGTQIFYSENNPKSFEIADKIKTSVVKLTQPDNTRETKPGKDIFLLSQTQNPAVIVECGFLSNPDEAAKLNSNDYQQQLAFAIYCGFLQALQ